MGRTRLTEYLYLEHCLESSLDGTLGEISYISSFMFYSCIEAITEAVHRWFHFLSTASVWLQHLLYQPRAYAFGTPTVFTRSVHQLPAYASSALTNQGETHQYIDHVVCFNTKDSHHRLKEHTIPYVFHAPRHDSYH